MVRKNRFGKVFVSLLLVAIGSALIFGGFEMAAYEHTIAEREVTENGTVTDTEVWQLPDGNWTYRINFEYRHDQAGEIQRLGIEDQYPSSMAPEQNYTSSHRGGKYDTKSEARDQLDGKLGEDPTAVAVYVDPFNPGKGSLSDALTGTPRILQYVGSLILAIGLYGLIRMSRRIST